MGPLRIVILLILFYILYRLLISAAGKSPRKGGNAPRQATSDIRDILEEDPVCHVCIPRKQAITLNKGRATVYFCSHACRQRFLNENKEQ